MRYLIVTLAAFCSSAAIAQSEAEPIDPAASVSADRLEADLERLVAFGTRHTMSAQDDPERGIGAAVDWGANSFRAISTECGNCLEVVLPERVVQGRRIPTPTRLRNAVAIQRGTERPNEVVIVQGHIDSRVSDVMDFTSDAPGANDDGSGTALVIEAARVLSKQKYAATIVYALLSGEEQGLYGGQLMADYAEEQGWTVKAVLNNDIVGGSCGSDGYCDDTHVRVFSEGPRADLTDDIRAAQRRNGGENDSPSRNLSRWLDTVADEYHGELDVRQIWRTDRMGRGGDQIPFLDKGYPAVRFSVAVEDYDHQHQDLREEEGVTYGDTTDEMDFSYLAKVTRLNVRALDRLAKAPMPVAPTIDAAVRTDTALSWQTIAGADAYCVRVRRTDEAAWRASVPAGTAGQDWSDCVVKSEQLAGEKVDFIVPLRGDDWIFGVQALNELEASPVASAVPAGSFAPISKEQGDSE